MRTILLLFTLAIIGSSCRTVPYYTTVKKMTQIRTGMKLDAVNSTLDISPHDYYLDVNNGKKIMVYKYKHRYHKVLKMEVSKERGLAGGSPRFRKANNAYFVFDQNSGKLDGFITDLGRKKGEKILDEENYLRLTLADPQKIRGLTSKSGRSISPIISKGKRGFFKKLRK